MSADRLNERTDRRLPRRSLLLGAGSLWYLYFWAVYLFAEAACTDGEADFTVLGVDGVSTAVVLSTLGTAVATAALTRRALRATAPDRSAGGPDHDRVPDPEAGDLRLIGRLLGWMFVIATLIVGASAVVLSPC